MATTGPNNQKAELMVSSFVNIQILTHSNIIQQASPLAVNTHMWCQPRQIPTKTTHLYTAESASTPDSKYYGGLYSMLYKRFRLAELEGILEGIASKTLKG